MAFDNCSLLLCGVELRICKHRRMSLDLSSQNRLEVFLKPKNNFGDKGVFFVVQFGVRVIVEIRCRVMP